MSAVWEKAPYREGTLLALLALADWANDEGVCWPKIAQVAHKARLSHSGAEYCMRKLTKEGAISVIKDNHRHNGKVYKLGPQYLRVLSTETLSRTLETLSGHSPNKEEPSLSTTVKIPIEIPYTVQKRNEAEREARIREAKSRGFASNDGWKTCYRKEMV
jgi:hypothetical protein